MRHRIKGKKLHRNRASRKALSKGLMKDLIEHEKIETTLPKAKFLRPKIEKLITKAKVNNLARRRYILSKIGDKKLTTKMLDDIGPRFTDRNGGYTQIIRTQERLGDRTQMAEISFVAIPKPKKETRISKKETKSKK